MKKQTLFLALLLALALAGRGQWEKTEIPNFICYGVSCPSKTAVFVSGDRGQVAKSTDGGLSWNVSHTGLDSSCILRRIYFLDENTGVAFSGMNENRWYDTSPLHFPHILIGTQNGGDTWTVLDTTSFFLKIKMVNQDTLYAMILDTNAQRHIAKSTDGGYHWDIILYGFSTQYNIRDFDIGEKNVFILLGGEKMDFYVLISEDGGQTWNQSEHFQQDRINGYAKNIVMRNDSCGAVVGPLFVSTCDGFTSFRTVTPSWSLNDYYYLCGFDYMDTQILPNGLGCSVGSAYSFFNFDVANNILLTNDCGEHWLNIGLDTLIDNWGQILDLDAVGDSTFFMTINSVDENWGYLLRSVSGFPKNIGVPDYQSRFFSLYPNPVKDVLYLHAYSDMPSNSNVEIYDATGRLFYRSPALSRISQISVSHLPPGTYFFVIQSRQGRHAQKFIKK